MIVLRVVIGSLLPGYLHPDEFFQGGQELFFGCPPVIPWEFEPHNAVRSIVPPTVVTWFPLRLYAWVMRIEMDQASGIEILLIPRVFCGLLSVLAVDLFVYLMTMRQKSDRQVPTSSMWIVATSWPAWVIVNRPFTNGIETMFLSMLLYMAILRPSIHQSRNLAGDLCVGVLCAMGLFTRFTFVSFAMPAMFMYLIRQWSARDGMIQTASCLTGFLATAFFMIIADASYYGSITNWMAFIAPWNAFLYNSKVNNLQHHGLHPRWTHVIVNMLMLYGPMTLLFYGKLARYIYNRTKQHGILQQACMWTIISGLGFLSFAPHQEPRFLTPILVPLAIFVGDTDLWSSVRLRSIWIGFNILLLVVFGILHQGGIVRAILSPAITHDAPQSIIFHHTYMPPSFLLRRLQCTDADVCSTTSCPITSINDLMGSSGQNLALALQRELHCDGHAKNHHHGRHVHLVTAPLPLEDGIHFSTNKCNVGSDFSCESMWTHWPHLTTEDLPVFEGLADFVQSFKLTIYNVGCK
ncbi:Alg9-like mannosyltransferase family [Fragilaria crotonensis]|nr:Alg9-like mannosyltransferase family [Fragilaria crotonensis]